MGRKSLWVGALFSVLALVGCPSGGAEAPTQQAKSLKLKYDESHPTEVGKELQLRLSYAGDPPQQLLGAMMGSEDNTATWFADPADAVEFDATGKATLKKTGKVKLWATYPQKGKVLKSNVIELTVTEVAATDEKK